jgi:cytoplasmic tRNA 2-thiolation protein 2
LDTRQTADCYSDCFIKYITSKPIKRIESYKLKNDAGEERIKLLLPVSGGVSSVVLLPILDQYLQRQTSRRGWSTYELHVLMVETSSTSTVGNLATIFNGLRQQFPSHTFSLLPLSAVFDLDESIRKDLSELGIREQVSAKASLETILSSITTPSSRADIQRLLLTRLIVTVSRTNRCSAILWADSDSRLAAKALSSVAGGRGGYLPFQIGDGLSPWGVRFHYPLRDLFKPELVTYATTVSGSLFDLILIDPLSTSTATSIRTTAIDDLLSSYIDSQGEKYPSIMANVVRTASKLQTPSLSTEGRISSCNICNMPCQRTEGDTEARRTWICYACKRLKLETRAQPEP